MKKTKSLLVLSVLMSISLISCGGNETSSSSPTSEHISHEHNSSEKIISSEEINSEDIISNVESSETNSLESSIESSESISVDTHEHILSEWVIVNPSFTEKGSATKSCTADDGYEISIELPTLDSEEYTIINDTSSCNAGGLITYAYVYENEIISFDVETTAKGHNYVWVEKVEATTEASGMHEHYYCLDCESYFDSGHKLVDVNDLIIDQISVWEYNETHHWTGENDNYAEHIWDEGETEGNYTTYSCEVCDATRVEEVPLGVLSSDYFLKFNEARTIEKNEKVTDGIRLAATSEKTLVLASSSKSSDGNAFTHALKLGGKINSDSRYIELAVSSPFKMRIYALSGDTSAARSLGLFTDLTGVPESSILKTLNVNSGSTITKIDVIVKDAGTYYIGSTSGGINIYGIDIVLGEFCDHNYSTTYSYDETHHYYECLNSCEEISSKEEHIYDNGVITKPATELETGIKVFSCLYCDFSYEEVLLIVTHNYLEAYERNETHHWNKCLDDGCGSIGNYAEHGFNEGEVIETSTITTNGKIKYTCTTCGYEKEENLPLIPSIKESKLVLMPSEEQTISDSIELSEGIVAYASSDKTISVDANSKSSDGNAFTHALNLGGKINPDSRYIEITVVGPCSVRIYALSSSTSAARNLAIFTTTEGAPDAAENIISTLEVAKGSTISKIDYTFENAGTYYLGSMSGGVLVFGLSFTF